MPSEAKKTRCEGPVKLTFVRRQQGTEVQCEVEIDSGGYSPYQAQLAAEIYLDACDLVDGSTGYNTKRESSDAEKARRRHHAIAANQKGKAKG